MGMVTSTYLPMNDDSLLKYMDPLIGGISDMFKSFAGKFKVSKSAKIRNRYNQVPHLTQDTNRKVTNSQQTPQTRAKRSALSQQVTTKHI